MGRPTNKNQREVTNGILENDCEIDSELRDAFAQCDKLEPISVVIGSPDSDGLVALSTPNIQTLDWALKDSGPWVLCMTFVRNTEDGEMKTVVVSKPQGAAVTVDLALRAEARVIPLRHLFYESQSGGTLKPNRAAVKYVREWVRRRSLPALEAAKVRCESAASQQAAEIDTLRRKHLS